MSTQNISILILLLSLSFFISCQQEEQTEEIIRPVRYTQVFSTGGIRARIFSGTAQSGMESKLSFKVQGTIRTMGVVMGDTVKKGQVIAELDPYDYELRVEQAEANLSQSISQARNADANYDRIRSLYENNNASIQDLDAARTASESSNAAVTSAEKQLELARLQLSYTELKAPLDGAIAEVNVEINENVNAGTPIVLLSSGSFIEVEISIPENLISQIESNKPVSVKFDAVPGNEYTGIVSEVGVSTTGMATTFPVTVRLDEAAQDIRAGMAANVFFRFESKEERVLFLVPSEAVGEDREGRYVYVAERIPGEEEFGTAKRKSVQVGDLTEEGIEILEGISDGDLVVTAGITHIVHGQKVKLWTGD
jgi:RND family efflux transporter MFP subunit